MACVLILDDEEDVVETLSTLLGTSFKVIGMTDPRSALDAIGRGGVDALVTDVVMPGMDGFRVALEAKQRQPDLPVVILSAYVDAENKDERQMLRRYGDIILSKPIQIQALIGALRHILRRPQQAGAQGQGRGVTPPTQTGTGPLKAS